MNQRAADQSQHNDQSQAMAASEIAARIEERLARVHDKLDRREHEELRGTLTRLHAYAQLLQATDRQQFLQDELASAIKQVQQIERHVDRQRQADRRQDTGFSFKM